METASQALGVLGERLASCFLRERGYQVLLKNYETPLGEIDLIARHGPWLVFVEVKTRRSDASGTPADSVTRRKRWQIVKVAQSYLKRYGLHDHPCRFDVVSIGLCPPGAPEIELIQDAFGERG